MNAQKTGWTGTALLVALLAFSGCGPSKERQAIDAFDRGNVHSGEGEFDKAVAEYNRGNPT